MPFKNNTLIFVLNNIRESLVCIWYAWASKIAGPYIWYGCALRSFYSHWMAFHLLCMLCGEKHDKNSFRVIRICVICIYCCWDFSLKCSKNSKPCNYMQYMWSFTNLLLFSGINKLYELVRCTIRLTFLSQSSWMLAHRFLFSVIYCVAAGGDITLFCSTSSIWSSRVKLCRVLSLLRRFQEK